MDNTAALIWLNELDRTLDNLSGLERLNLAKRYGGLEPNNWYVRYGDG